MSLLFFRDISNNKLEEISKDTFEHLTSLIILKLDNNRISYIEEGVFKFLPSLEVLYVLLEEYMTIFRTYRIEIFY